MIMKLDDILCSNKNLYHLARPFATFGVMAYDFVIRKKIKEGLFMPTLPSSKGYKRPYVATK